MVTDGVRADDEETCTNIINHTLYIKSRNTHTHVNHIYVVQSLVANA